VDGFDDLFALAYDFDHFDLELFCFLDHVGHRDFVDDWHLFGDVERNYLFDLDVFGSEDFPDYGFIDEDFDLTDDFDLIALDEVRPFDENFLGGFSQQFFLLRDGYFLDDFAILLHHYGFVPVLDYIHQLDFWYSYFYGYF
jgi:hypothetical protein